MSKFFDNPIYQFSKVHLENEYRYSLRAEILDAKSNRHLLVIQLNPSKANGSKSDATAGKVCNWAARENFAVVHFLNLFARIATIQKEIPSDISYEKLVGSKNNLSIIEILDLVPKDLTVVFAYRKPTGALYLHHSKRVSEIEALLKQQGVKKVFHVGALSHKKFPRHGRAWNKNVKLEVYSELEKN
jgi:hypothetical protein